MLNASEFFIPRLALQMAAAVAGLTLTAAAPPPAPISAEDAALVAEATAYLQALTTEKARFTQTDARGATSEGTFWLQRPGRARFEYDPPSGLVIASNGQMVTVVDRRLAAIHSYPLGFTPLSLFLARDIRLDKGVAVTAVTRREGGFSIAAADAPRRNQGSIVLDFAVSPIALVGWTITDARGRSVHVALAGLGPSAPRQKGFFELADPVRARGASPLRSGG